jgi:DNA-binding LytR/AlgR family response regulator
MNVEIKIDAQALEPRVAIYTAKLTSSITALVELIEGAEEAHPFMVVAKKDDKSYVIEPEQVEIIRTEGGVVTLYNRKGHDFTLSKPLHSLLEQLGNNFIRISKSAIVNINHVDHISPHFNGTMYIVMKNGINDYISRNQLGSFKSLLGL